MENQPFAFLKFPAELRIRIYTFAREDDGTPCPLTQKKFTQKDSKTWHTPTNDSSRKFLGLTQTCRQIREEFRSIW
ncbi:hypothetical protein N0V90_012308 [Kalmusia sp. IMI 367209]|nr:hypothetical protein N0V90_012308 [Kalmusia sp. IMI 367209]